MVSSPKSIEMYSRELVTNYLLESLIKRIQRQLRAYQDHAIPFLKDLPEVMGQCIKAHRFLELDSTRCINHDSAFQELDFGILVRENPSLTDFISREISKAGSTFRSDTYDTTKVYHNVFLELLGLANSVFKILAGVTTATPQNSTERFGFRELRREDVQTVLGDSAWGFIKDAGAVPNRQDCDGYTVEAYEFVSDALAFSEVIQGRLDKEVKAQLDHMLLASSTVVSYHLPMRRRLY